MKSSNKCDFCTANRSFNYKHYLYKLSILSIDSIYRCIAKCAWIKSLPGFPKNHSTFAKKYSTFAKKYSTFAKKYSTSVKKYSTFAKKYSTFAEKYSTFAKKYSTSAKKYSTFAKKYSTFAFFYFKMTMNIEDAYNPHLQLHFFMCTVYHADYVIFRHLAYKSGYLQKKVGWNLCFGIERRYLNKMTTISPVFICYVYIMQIIWFLDILAYKSGFLHKKVEGVVCFGRERR